VLGVAPEVVSGDEEAHLPSRGDRRTGRRCGGGLPAALPSHRHWRRLHRVRPGWTGGSQRRPFSGYRVCPHDRTALARRPAVPG
jgi:hypothetical protein